MHFIEVHNLTYIVLNNDTFLVMTFNYGNLTPFSGLPLRCHKGAMAVS